MVAQGVDLMETATTRTVAAHECADYWSDQIGSFHLRRMGYAYLREHGFQGRAILRRTGNYQLVGWRADAVTYYRTARHVRADPDDDFRLIMPTTGQVIVSQGDEHVSMPRGVGGLVTIDQPFAFAQVDGTEGLTMTIPRTEVAHRLNRATPPTPMLDFTTGLGRVIADLAISLTEESETLSRHQFDAVSGRLVDLLCMHIVGDHPTEQGHLDEVESLVRQYIRAHAYDPDLCGESVARALGWSLRQIQLALQHSGTTPRELIKEERLQLAYTRLRGSAYERWSISAIALGVGFSSASAFSTSFRRRFGASPREIRYS
ncbi:helix-turn-helix domain-containing protein [Nocardia callitridis]|uniref:Helix-turn-helix domain-containing protein n=2 Tax=Nocardia callitridis TaxID=648753 RepID=A0ABP9KPQ7_9NOCA